jgi:probable phosphoglycerate mutase
MRSPSAMRFPGGESLVDVQARTVAELDRIARDHPHGVVAVVSHADVVALALAHHAGMHLDHYQRLTVDPASISVVVVGDHASRLVKVNDTGGLASLVPSRRSKAKLRG